MVLNDKLHVLLKIFSNLIQYFRSCYLQLDEQRCRNQQGDVDEGGCRIRDRRKHPNLPIPYQVGVGDVVGVGVVTHVIP